MHELYSFGAVLYEVATGKEPFSGECPATVYDAILNRKRAPETVDTNIPERLGGSSARPRRRPRHYVIGWRPICVVSPTDRVFEESF